MKKQTQADQVINAIKKLGGIATLSQLNQNVDVSNWPTKTPAATIRRITQNDERLYKLKPGLYCLKNERHKYEKDYKDDNKTEEGQLRNHSYYQGLLLEIGQAKGFDTYVPNQDRNRKFLNAQTLGQMSNIHNIPMHKLPKFGYDNIMRKAVTVDVIWINERKMPAAFFEVETSTAMERSLVKFSTLQDFAAEMHIVAPESRHREFEDRINDVPWKPIRTRVKFQSTDKLSTRHTKSMTSTLI